MADLGALGKLVTADMPVRKAFFIDQTGVRFLIAGTARIIPKRWNPATSTWDVIPGP